MSCSSTISTNVTKKPRTGEVGPGRRASNYWDHTIGVEGKDIVACIHCQKELFKKYSRVADLRKHIDTDCKVFKRDGLQSSVTDYFPPRPDSDVKEAMAHLCDWFYATGTPFERIEHPALLNFAKALNADVDRLPTRKQLSGPYLDGKYEDYRGKVASHVDVAEHVCLTSDGWSDVNSNSVVNYMAVCSNAALRSGDQFCTFLLDAEYTGSASHTGETMAAKIISIVESHEGGQTKFTGLCTDNASNNKLMWQKVQEKYPFFDCYGCICHTLHLAIKDIVEGSPSLKLLEEDSVDIVTFFKRSNIRLAELNEISDDVTMKLALPGATRWGSLLKCWQSLKSNYEKMFAYTDRESFMKSGDKDEKSRRLKIKTRLASKASFIAELDAGIAIISSFNFEIIRLQNDSLPISEVYACFLKLINHFATQTMPSAIKALILRVLWSRWDFVGQDIHNVAYLLDPRYVGKNMEICQGKPTNVAVDDVIDEINKRSINYTPAGMNPQDCNIVRNGEFEHFKNYMTRLHQKEDYMHALDSGALSVLSFWKSRAQQFPNLSRVALRVFACPCSSAASERNFSTFSFIHSKLRNRLKDTRVQKLVCIYASTKKLCFFNEGDLDIDDFAD